MLLFAFTTTAFSQKTEKNTLTKADYLQRVRNKKLGAWLLIGGGTAMVVGGLAINWDQPFFGAGTRPNKGLWLSYVGCASLLGSIPLFISAHKDKKKAASLAINLLDIKWPEQNGLVLLKQPALSLRIPL